MALDLVFPENTGRLPNSKLPLQLKHVLAVVYVFGGFSALMALLSKLIVKPLFEQLTAQRQELAQAVRYKLVKFNCELEHSLKDPPSLHSIKHGYADTLVRTEKRGTGKTASSGAYKLERNDLKDECSAAEKSLLDEIKSLEEYMRDVAFGYSSTSSNAKAKSSTVAEFRSEVRSFKGALLAL
ncbi:hypothetical protein B9G98_01808 [Wickerhamiella sorbophila]|uniref:Peroxin-14 n=1 Tax=Wickerhamiella sorbophila TaxID=45607 RepID=A0A2T0FEE3_9ASCO|nr:hypothetical protein B9G98_00974 [Wickerhamiella sorbophila]XP_024664133.1 hypothetical protein B9G98_01808 [Wickerhamiella sorbophila]PRT53354.1 hypothetical protein B9G98_00974 [Wickerhamiella sorbophila]PRT54188.1 hypothetical protein B9G98_01808 [Wickerhamiella sorbophila]